MRVLFIFIVGFCLLQETTALAEEDVFKEERPPVNSAQDFQTLEEANADLAPGANESPVMAPAPADIVAEEEAREAREAAERPVEIAEEADEMGPNHSAVLRVEHDGNIERIILKNGDVIMNVKGEADVDKALSKALGGSGSSEAAEAPYRKTEDWASVPAIN